MSVWRTVLFPEVHDVGEARAKQEAQLMPADADKPAQRT